MSFCERCGSTSRDKDGFCGGCGAPWPHGVMDVAPQNGTETASPYAKLPAQITAIGLEPLRPKIVWVAVLLALALGPLGLLYCTMTGTVVMIVASIMLRLLIGNASLLIILPACAFWAWRAARESSATFD